MVTHSITSILMKFRLEDATKCKAWDGLNNGLPTSLILRISTSTGSRWSRWEGGRQHISWAQDLVKLALLWELGWWDCLSPSPPRDRWTDGAVLAKVPSLETRWMRKRHSLLKDTERGCSKEEQAGFWCVCLCVSHLVVSDSLRHAWAIAHKAPLSVEFSRQEYWSG